MRVIATLLNELGFKKVVGLLDGDQATLLPKLNEEFPKYKFGAIPADDVRTKPEIPLRQAVIGIIDESGKVRPKYEMRMREMLTFVNQALQSAD